MAGKKISELSSSLSLSLTGVTPVVLNQTTYKTTLSTMRHYLVDSGSHYFTGSQHINGNLTITGSIKSLIVGTGSFHVDNPEILHVQNSGSFNIAHFEANNQYYAQVNIKNTNSGNNSSTDLVLTADNGTETNHYIDLGINSSTYTGGLVGLANDSYLLNVGKDMYIGTVGGSQHPANLKLFAQNLWETPQISISGSRQISFNTGSVSSGYTYEFSGSAKLKNELKVDGSVTASYFVGDGSRLTNLPNGLGGGDIADFTFTSETITNDNVSIVATDGDIVLNADGNVYKGSANAGNGLVTDGYLGLIIGDEGRINSSTGNSITDNLDNIINSIPTNFATTGSNTFKGNQIISGSNHLSVGTIQNLSGSLDLLTDGENVNILGSNLVIPNGGINTSFTLTSNGATINEIINIDSVTEKLVVYDEPASQISHNFLMGSIAYVSNASSDLVIDVIEVPTTDNKAIGLTVMIEQGSPAYKITGLKINSGSPLSISWYGGSQPNGTINSTDIFAFSLIRINNTWRVLGQKTTF